VEKNNGNCSAEDRHRHQRHFTTEGVHPYDGSSGSGAISRITDYRDGSVPSSSLMSRPHHLVPERHQLLAQKYSGATPRTDERETSLRQVIDRVVDTTHRVGA